MQPLKNKTSVQSRAYRLLKPGEISEVTLEHEIRDGEIVVQPSMGSICHADLRYFTGQRRPEALAKKLPMALIHEGIGTVVESTSPDIQMGQRVIIVPNLPGYLLRNISPQFCCPACQKGLGENYCHYGKFLGSGFDGIAQSHLVLPAACAIPIPDEVPDEIAVLAELCSVSYQAASRIADRLPASRVAVFGDGPVGYLTAAVLHHVFGVTKDRLHVLGAIPEKLEQFQFASRALVQEYDFTHSASFDIAVECTGGRFSESAINQAIDIMSPGGALLLMGVTEERVPMNTRDILEKGLLVIGSSRSSYSDYHPLISAMKDIGFQTTLRRLLPDQNVTIRTSEDFAAVMKEAAEHRGWKKTVLNFQW
ncbi:alcohol dehydrogenase catalytic domain-containing protein [Paenibacillus naphthalenovorans]|uniref:alcohol dehydrogenase catalytic domain-containing protein n=1 Tax=Paenibacillus naphthalenovorans TaxID=162209 RepID=UPI0008918AFA|nr:alcohol dehydrogenase catalytic domain-containing protein [Paenibacillus naphthalenovorans]SDI35586.1 ribitol-5-phosphate 2-dehydrogenase [Paenibacillus naphthalenovorans]